MRTRIKVMDLSAGQWDYLQRHLTVRPSVPDGAVRVCVEFELHAQESEHLELGVRQFMALMTRLAEIQARAEAALTPDALPDKWSAPLSELSGPACGCRVQRCALHSGGPYWRNDT